MLSKCIGMISWFPDGELGNIRRKQFRKTLKEIDEHFKLPIVIIAQNWKPEDYDLEYGNTIKVYSYKSPLGITGANVILRNKLLLEDYDYFIHLDDDIHFIGTQKDFNDYLKCIDAHPNMFGQLKKFQLAAQSKYMLEKMNWDYIKGMESCRGEIWEDVAYMNTYKKVYPDKFFTIDTKLKMDFVPSEKDPNTTWWDKSKNQKTIQSKTSQVVKEWVKLLKGM